MARRFKDQQEIQRHALARGAEAVINGRSFNATRRSVRQAPKGTALPPAPPEETAPPPPPPPARPSASKPAKSETKPAQRATEPVQRASEPAQPAYPRTMARAVDAAPIAPAPVAELRNSAISEPESSTPPPAEKKRPCAVKTDLTPTYSQGGYLQSMTVRTECDDGSVKEHRVNVQYTQSGLVSGMTITPTNATTEE